MNLAIHCIEGFIKNQTKGDYKMPNHVTNVLSIISDDKVRVQQIFETIQDDEIGKYSIDFKKIIPIPHDIYQGELGPTEKEIYGENNWYDWNIKNWGTKWGAYAMPSSQSNEKTIYFDTAWSTPFPVIVALSKKFPEETFRLAFADEDRGSNLGIVTLKGGEVIEQETPQDQSKEAFKLYKKIMKE
jgi:hypothetical protein